LNRFYLPLFETISGQIGYMWFIRDLLFQLIFWFVIGRFWFEKSDVSRQMCHFDSLTAVISKLKSSTRWLKSLLSLQKIISHSNITYVLQLQRFILSEPSLKAPKKTFQIKWSSLDRQGRSNLAKSSSFLSSLTSFISSCKMNIQNVQNDYEKSSWTYFQFDKELLNSQIRVKKVL